MTEPLLDVQGLDLTLRTTPTDEPRAILRGVSFDVRERESVALVGESGSGKSMTARSIIRLLPRRSELAGKIEFRASSVLAMKSAELLAYRRRDVAMIFQDARAHIDPTRTVGDFLSERLVISGMRTRRNARARAVELLESVQIGRADQRLDQHPHEFSGGMLQRVMIASALATEPALLLADEPTTALDVTVQAEILRVLRDLREQHQLAMLFITHDLALAEKTCDRTVVMYAGRVVEVNDTAGLQEAAVHPYTIGLMRSRPSPNERRARLGALAGRPIAAADVAGECAFRSRCSLAEERCCAGEPPLREWEGSLVACVRPEDSRQMLLVAAEDEAVPMPAARSDEILIEASHLRRVFGHRGLLARSVEPTVAVEDASFSVARGESLAIVGESGSGKTTIARMLVGLEKPTSGEVEVTGHRRLGRRLEGLSRKESAKRIQIVFQDPYQSLDPSQTVAGTLKEILRFAIGLRGEDLDRRVRELAGQVGIDEHLLTRYPRALSGGQRQRVAIARALASEPAVLVLDEATASLDASIQAQILNLLADLRERLGLTYVFVTHDLSVVRQVCDAVVVFRAGSIVERGTVEAILDTPSEEYTQRLVASSPARMTKMPTVVSAQAS